MHIFFSGIGGAGIGPLALIALQAGYTVSGSDKQNSQYVEYLIKHGVTNIHIGQEEASIAHLHTNTPIDWYVYSSAVEKENPDAPELKFVQAHGIKSSKRDAFITHFLSENRLKMLAVAGTHGKTTTTAMTVWLLQQIHIPISYVLAAKTSFAEMGAYDSNASLFVYEADEFDRNFLAFHPLVSLISGVTWDHHEIFKTREDYKQAFRQFISQSNSVVIWHEDAEYLGLEPSDVIKILPMNDPYLETLTLAGRYNRSDARLVVQAVHDLTNAPVEDLIAAMNKFPGLQRRMEEIAPGLYSDYAHTPEKIRGAISVAKEIAALRHQKLVVIYEPLTNRRQHYVQDEYKDSFAGTDKLYWIPSYLAREDPSQRILPPKELITKLSDPSIAEARQRDETLLATIRKHIENGDMVVGIAGGGGDSLDEWLRAHFTQH